MLIYFLFLLLNQTLPEGYKRKKYRITYFLILSKLLCESGGLSCVDIFAAILFPTLTKYLLNSSAMACGSVIVQPVSVSILVGPEFFFSIVY